MLVGVDVKTDADGYRIVCCDAWIKSWLGLRHDWREFECDAAFNNVTAWSRSGLFCSSHFVLGDFFFFRLKKQQHLQLDWILNALVSSINKPYFQLTLCRRPFRLLVAVLLVYLNDQLLDHQHSILHLLSLPPVNYFVHKELFNIATQIYSFIINFFFSFLVN